MITLTNQKKFLRDITKFSELSGIQVGLVAKKFAFEAFRSVIQKTPVDTGRARAAWNIEEGQVDPSIPSEEEFAGGNTNLAAQINSRQLSKTFVVRQFPVFFVTNDLEYIVPLENGHSPQSGKGFMVARTIIQLQADANRLVQGLT